MPLRAVVFDYGKVLCQPQPPAVREALATRLGASQEAFEAAYGRFRLEYDRGTLDDVAYWQSVAQACGRTLDAETALWLADVDARGWSHPNLSLVDWAGQVRQAGFQTAILSNMQRSLRQRLEELCPWLPEVDAAVFSSDLGYVKPEPEMYRRVVELLAVAPQEALFIDDVEANVAGARQVGLSALRFTDVPTLRQALTAFPELPPIL
ncbi:HAD family phosphatase [Chloracidobacterium aggregatum]|uniref:HAD family hydrolase n=1 Tax=Chloracidobacterium aggregatum TaxID=2851959 RepID=UPI001B8AFEAD|nr:HAD family phosphatase [Chloracidobacterium aggregatum]QUV85102.1 HAD family phosphatase [Chloracidobacterium sp. 2]QUV88497.1 HAD family phosphatase [Chloracidobacterium sp. S]QUV91420.1 HAD family phosphatase [Chloracidobacterium sp. A]QUV97798.1 HAD family phosphatase [Chloracidobacterium sp. E]